MIQTANQQKKQQQQKEQEHQIPQKEPSKSTEESKEKEGDSLTPLRVEFKKQPSTDSNTLIVRHGQQEAKAIVRHFLVDKPLMTSTDLKTNPFLASSSSSSSTATTSSTSSTSSSEMPKPATFTPTTAVEMRQPKPSPKTAVENKKTNEKVDEEEEEEGESGTACFNMNYDETNRASSLACSLKSGDVASYNHCFRAFAHRAVYQKTVAEFLGTALLTAYVCSIGSSGETPLLNKSLGGGLALAAIVWSLGGISGGHVNPAVTLACFCTGKINPLLATLYILAQSSGAYTGVTALNYLITGHHGAEAGAEAEARGSRSLGLTQIHKDISVAQACCVEFVVTFILVLTIFACVDSRRQDTRRGSGPLQIGFAAVVGNLFASQFSGGSMNPARSFGPAAVAGVWKDQWVYWAGPMGGAVTAGLLYHFWLGLKCPKYRQIRMTTN